MSTFPDRARRRIGAIVVALEDRIDPSINARAIAIAASLKASAIAGVRDIVPTYCTVAVFFDPLRTDHDALVERIEHEAATPAPQPPRDPAVLRIPVCYGGDFGPDLDAVAQFGCISADEVIALHAAPMYRVFMLGFVPGFAYLGVVDGRIAAPRRASPRVRVPTGSVGIAGVQTGIYPAETPGGWQLIGRTPLRPFDAQRAQPFLMAAGDAVQFYPVERDGVRSPRMSGMIVLEAGPVDDDSGSRARGMAGAGRAGGRPDGSLFASSRQRARRQ